MAVGSAFLKLPKMDLLQGDGRVQLQLAVCKTVQGYAQEIKTGPSLSSISSPA